MEHQNTGGTTEHRWNNWNTTEERNKTAPVETRNNKTIPRSTKIRIVLSHKKEYIKEYGKIKEMSFVGEAIKSFSTVELLSITLDKNLNFKSRIKTVCCKAK